MTDWQLPDRTGRPVAPGPGPGGPPSSAPGPGTPPGPAGPVVGAPGTVGGVPSPVPQVPQAPPRPVPPPPAPPVATGWGSLPPPPPGGGYGPSRPSVGDVIETMFNVYRRTFPTMATVIAILLLPGLVLLGIGLMQNWDLFGLFLDPTAIDGVNAAQVEAAFTNPVFWIALGLGGLLAFIGQLAATPALMRVGADHLADDVDARAGPAVKVGLRKLWGLAGVMITLGLAVTLLVLLPLPLVFGIDNAFAALFVLTVPVGIFLVLVLSLVFYLLAATVVVEDVGAWRGLGLVRSRLRGSFWPTLGRGLLVGLLVTIIGNVLGFASQLAVFGGPEAFLIATVVVNIVSYLVATPLGVFGGLALYGDLRVRTEGTDVLRAAGRLAR